MPEWFDWGARLTWALLFVLTLAGGGVAWFALVISLCEDAGNGGSQEFCNGNGGTASGVVMFGLGLGELVFPALSLRFGKRRLFWASVLTLPLLALLDLALSDALGRR